MARQKISQAKLTALAFLFAGLFSQGVRADQLTDQAKMLIDSGKANEAFSLLEPSESARSGDVAFDLLFAIAAIEVGQNTRAVFALERVLSVQPGNARARAEIARAYLALGETDLARREFEAVKQQGVPPEVSDTIDRFLDAVDRVELVSRNTLRGYVESSVGYDTNVNVGPNRNTVAIPGFGGLPFTLSSNSKANEAPFATVGGGLNLRSPISGTVALVGGVSGVLRQNFGKQQFDSVSDDAYAGIVINRDKSIFSINAQYNQYILDSNRYREAIGLSGQWQYNIDARNQASLFAQYSDLSYQTQSVRDADRWVVGGAFAHAYRGGEVTYASLYWLNERPHNGAVPWLGLDGLGVRLGGQMSLDAKTVLFANGSIEYRRYGADDPSFLTTRQDTQYDLTIGANYTPARNWKVTPKVALTQNESNTELNKYHCEVVSVTVRYDF